MIFLALRHSQKYLSRRRLSRWMHTRRHNRRRARSPRGTWQTVREVADIRNVSLQAYRRRWIKMDVRARVAAMKSAVRGRSRGPRPSSQSVGAGRFAWRRTTSIEDGGRV